MIYTLDEIEAMPTIHEGHFANLKIDTGTIRVWLSRMTLAELLASIAKQVPWKEKRAQ